MPNRTDLALRDATLDDLDNIAEMRRAVGWAVHEWALRAVIGRPYARCVVIEADSGGLAAVGSGIAYGALGFVGNMVVAEPYRRRGMGSQILDAVVGWLEAVGCTRFELNATPEGQPLYRRHGFTSRGWSSTGVVRRTADLERDQGLDVRVAGPDDLDPVVAFDEPRFGGSRQPIIRLLLEDPACHTLIAEANGSVAGFATIRTDDVRLGPMVADLPSIASTLLGAAFDAVPTADELRLNVPPGNGPGREWLGQLGVEIGPWDGRMGRGPDIPRREETIYQMAVGALG